MLFGVYLLIRKRAVLRYIYRLLAVWVSLLANMRALYHISSLISSRFEKNLRDTALVDGSYCVLSIAYRVFSYLFAQNLLDFRWLGW